MYCFVALLSVHQLPINVSSSPAKPITSSQSVYCTVLIIILFLSFWQFASAVDAVWEGAESPLKIIKNLI
jgi:hypothetical protein